MAAAKAKVKTAEQKRTKKTKSAVGKLKASAEKTKLQKRINAIKLK
ncbi:hypothetical protein [Bacillus sp. (in: firmicutes)]|nr:hypothetical protein [Bacillus sp. (in: firmicutes)]TWK72747.1 hypothetical protein CHCC20335_1412 [Bacillus paralicheniformis]